MCAHVQSCYGAHTNKLRYMTVPEHFYDLKEAVRQSGKNRTTIMRQIKGGKYSAQKDDDNKWRIDPSEFHRVYPLRKEDEEPPPLDAHSEQTPEMHNSAQPNAQRTDTSTADTIALVRTMVETVEKKNTEEIKRLQETIDDLRARLDAEAKHNREVTLRLTHEPKEQKEIPKKKFLGLF